MQQILALLDARGTIVYCTDYSHVTDDRVVGKTPWELGYTTAEESERLKHVFADALLFKDERQIRVATVIHGKPRAFVVGCHAIPPVSVAALWTVDPVDQKISTLTGRERQICQLIGRGHDPKKIAALLGRKVSTVHTFLSRIRGKLHLNPIGLAGWCAVNRDYF